MSTVQDYREKADRARRLAQAITDTDVREQLEVAAKEYDEIADQLEAGAVDGEEK